MNNENNKVIKITDYLNKKDSGKIGAKIDIYSNNPKNGPHDSIHFKVNTENKTYQTVTKINGEKETSNGGCFLTTACMKYYQENFNDNCYELTILRWFRDNFVSKDDIEHYYEVAPMIVEAINKDKKIEIIYDYIYENVIEYCIEQIMQGKYEIAYNRYKNSILALEKQFVKSTSNKEQSKKIKIIY